MSIKTIKASDLIVHKNSVFVNNNNKPFMIFFKASWCGHCIKFSPVYKELSLKTNSFNFYEIDNTELDKNPKVAEILKIQGFPTLFTGNKSGLIVEQYEGNRSMDSLVSKIKTVCKYCVN